MTDIKRFTEITEVLPKFRFKPSEISRYRNGTDKHGNPIFIRQVTYKATEGPLPIEFQVDELTYPGDFQKLWEMVTRWADNLTKVDE